MKIQIAENIKKFRMAQGFTQGDLAVLLSVSAQAVSRWENGQAFPDITCLPLLAKYLNVSIDELMGQEEQQNRSLEKELRQRMRASISDEAERLQNEMRILEIYEALGRTKLFYLRDYFQHLMRLKSREKRSIKGLEERIEKARQMMRERMRASGMGDRIRLLQAVASYEDADKLELWADEYELPEFMKVNLWDELMLSRYVEEKNIDRWNEQTQKILYKQIESTVSYMVESTPGDMKFHTDVQMDAFWNPEKYRTALDMLSLYSTRTDDIFIFIRIIAEVRYAEALLYNGRTEECLELYARITEHLSVLYDLPEGCLLHGSSPVLDTVHISVGVDDKLTKCVFYLGIYDNLPFDPIRRDPRFTAYLDALDRFFPKAGRGFWVHEPGMDALDPQWEMLLGRAEKEVEKLPDGETVAVLTAKGTVASISFQNLNSASDAEGAMKFLIEMKKNGDAKIERLVCMWHVGGGVDLPSFAFREALLAIDSGNCTAKMLLNGLNGYIVKTVQATMPKGYRV